MPCFLICMYLDVHVLLQMELKLRLMELNWQKSQCVKVITADERTKNEVRVGGLFLFFAGDVNIVCWPSLNLLNSLVQMIINSIFPDFCTEMLKLNLHTTGTSHQILHSYPLNRSVLQLKKQRLKEKIEADVGAMVQFLLDERDSLLESLDAEEVANMAVIDDNLKIVEKEAADVDKAISNIHSHISGKTSFEVSQHVSFLIHRGELTLYTVPLHELYSIHNPLLWLFIW